MNGPCSGSGSEGLIATHEPISVPPFKQQHTGSMDRQASYCCAQVFEINYKKLAKLDEVVQATGASTSSLSCCWCTSCPECQLINPAAILIALQQPLSLMEVRPCQDGFNQTIPPEDMKGPVCASPYVQHDTRKHCLSAEFLQSVAQAFCQVIS